MFASKRKQSNVYIALIVSIFSLLVFIFWGYHAISLSSLDMGIHQKSAVNKKRAPETSLNLEPFLFSDSFSSVNLAKVVCEDLTVLAINTRPDNFQMPFVLALGVKGQSEPVYFNSKRQKHYLRYLDGGQLEVSDDETGLYITIDPQGARQLAAHLHFEAEGVESSALISECIKSAGKEVISKFKGALCLGEDKLQQFYGSATGPRLYFENGEKNYFLALTRGGYFIHDRGQWRKAGEVESAGEHALFQVDSVTSDGVDLWVWPCGDLKGGAVHLKPMNEERLPVGVEKLFTASKRRMKDTFSCRFNKKLAVFKVGDWLFEENGRWHLVKTAGELDAIVSGGKTGCLIVIEQIVEEKEKKTVACKVFSPYRTCHEEFSIPLGKASAPAKQKRGRPVRNVHKKVGGKAAK